MHTQAIYALITHVFSSHVCLDNSTICIAAGVYLVCFRASHYRGITRMIQILPEHRISDNKGYSRSINVKTTIICVNLGLH